MNANSTDTDSDGFTDKEEIDAGSNPISQSSVPSTTGDINADGQLDAGDLVLAHRHVLGLINLTSSQIARGDLYPAGGDGLFTLSDLILLQQLMLATP